MDKHNVNTFCDRKRSHTVSPFDNSTCRIQSEWLNFVNRISNANYNDMPVKHNGPSSNRLWIENGPGFEISIIHSQWSEYYRNQRSAVFFSLLFYSFRFAGWLTFSQSGGVFSGTATRRADFNSNWMVICHLSSSDSSDLPLRVCLTCDSGRRWGDFQTKSIIWNEINRINGGRVQARLAKALGGTPAHSK